VAKRATSARRRRFPRWRGLRWALVTILALLALLGTAAALAGAGMWWFRRDGTSAKLGHDGRTYLQGYVGAVLFSPDAHLLFACTSATPTAWELPAGRTRQVWASGRIGKRLLDADRPCALSPDGTWLAAATNPWWPEPREPGTLHLWSQDLAASPRVLARTGDHTDTLAFDPTGAFLAVTRNAYDEQRAVLHDGKLLVYDIASGEVVDRIEQAGRTLRSVLYLPTGELVFVRRWREPLPAFAREESALVVRERDGSKERILVHSRETPIRAVRASAQGGRLLVTFEESPLVKVIDTQGGVLAEIATADPLHPGQGGGALSPDGEWLAFPVAQATGPRPLQRWARGIGLWNVKAGDLRRLLSVRSGMDGFAVHELAFSPDGRVLAAGLGSTYTGQVALWNLTEVLR
jgi:WD40 repeat protein